VCRAQVVRLEEDVEGELPVHLLRVGARVVDVGPRQVESLEVGSKRTEEVARVQLGVGLRNRARRTGEHEPGRLSGGHAHEAALVLVDAGEAFLVRDPEEVTVTSVRPRVIRADERLLAAAARQLFDARAPMAADVEERRHLAVVTAHHQEGNAAQVVGDEVAGGGEHRRMCDH
jgi:hypothetical protein